MNKAVMAAIVMLAFVPAGAVAQERAGDAALGALRGRRAGPDRCRGGSFRRLRRRALHCALMGIARLELGQEPASAT